MGPYSVKTGQIVYVNDSSLFLAPLDGKGPVDADTKGKNHRRPEVELRLYVDRLYVDLMGSLETWVLLQRETPIETVVSASTALFGADPAIPNPPNPVPFGHGEGVRLVRDASNPLGCAPYSQKYSGEAVVVRRGECTFLDKLIEAAIAGFSGVIVISDEHHSINPSADAEDLALVGDLLDDVVVVVVNKDDGEVVTSMMNAVENFGVGQVKVAIGPTPQTAPSSRNVWSDPEAMMVRARAGNRVLYLNGHPLINTRILV